MSNYPNMSYCMCENTLGALGQVLEAMQEGDTEFIKDLSRTERRAFDELFEACKEFMELAEELQTRIDYEETDEETVA